MHRHEGDNGTSEGHHFSAGSPAGQNNVISFVQDNRTAILYSVRYNLKRKIILLDYQGDMMPMMGCWHPKTQNLHQKSSKRRMRYKK